MSSVSILYQGADSHPFRFDGNMADFTIGTVVCCINENKHPEKQSHRVPGILRQSIKQDLSGHSVTTHLRSRNRKNRQKTHNLVSQ